MNTAIGTLPCTHCDPPGVVWHFEHGENPSNPEHGQSYTCAECNGAGVVPDPDFDSTETDMADSRKWYFVQRPGVTDATVLIYASRAHALSAAACRNFDCPNLPPCQVVEVVETGAQFVVAAEAQAAPVEAIAA